MTARALSAQSMLLWASVVERLHCVEVEPGLIAVSVEIAPMQVERVGTLRALCVARLLSRTPCMWVFLPSSAGTRLLFPPLRQDVAIEWLSAWLEAEGILTRPDIGVRQ